MKKKICIVIANYYDKIGLDLLSGAEQTLKAYRTHGINLAEKTILQVVINRCPDIELTKPYWTTKLDY